MAVSHKNWELPNSWIWLVEIDIESTELTSENLAFRCWVTYDYNIDAYVATSRSKVEHSILSPEDR